ncbi:epoxide hydrolase family protein [Cellulomonas fimi]|uniref:Microsomal epoxide hydrolase n=1 Tax=Cellulomonas fimi (strain ATCC 484 / DSM 20113 / JCM 1341 / CCUG 24087 / LMG 16345 / NBRC 15513 / NCIMB 8980 / NCTC 7547 / NRS-133) TaxID=590998 RepID=F4H7H9_CELFA|nr:epoxide hydrolase family protein [Cellulomonas fimi]AEE44536.1 Microsomal epoxide hydrolase [Cellulomonas fimi ATCC 484]NNH06488.1 epoxide hydrolase [Cellulomonas fimi]VEH26562.1 Soluble epoxide hydrolase [Cellulomonas fimi]
MEPVTAHLPEGTLADLRARLARTRWPPTLPEVGWDRGVPADVLRDLVDAWLRHDWTPWQDRLDALPQVVTHVDGQRVHALHVRSHDPDALALVLTHGWPGSILDWLPVVERLRDTFHLVVPSLPGFGFSTPLAGPGWDYPRIARACAALMAHLGYTRYGAAGGDSGSIVSPWLARVDPVHVVGVHVHGSLDVPDVDASLLDTAEAERLAAAHRRTAEDTGYAVLQGTRPHTVAYALHDSPVAQLAWVADKVHDWGAWPPDVDHLLATATLYWCTGAGATSAHLYRETRGAPPLPPSDVPTAVALFPTDPTVRRVAAQQHRLVRWTEHAAGSHFAAVDAPDALAADLRAFFDPLRR